MSAQEAIGLVGRYIEHFGGHDDDVYFCGCVVGDLGNGYYLVEYLDDLDRPCKLRIHHIAEMKQWGFQRDKPAKH
jgi:hypothetical protein